jgi:hypothetical protein
MNLALPWYLLFTYRDEGACKHVTGYSIDQETGKMASLSHFLAQNPALKTHKEVISDSNCPGVKNVSSRLFEHTLQLQAYIAHYNELLLQSCPTAETPSSEHGSQARVGERPDNKIGREEMKTAKVNAQPGMQLAKSMNKMGASLSEAFTACTAQTNASREKTAKQFEKNQAGMNLQKELSRHEDKIRRQVKDWRATQQGLIAHNMDLLKQINLLFEDAAERKIQIALLIAEMNKIKSEPVPPEVSDVSQADKELLASFKATFEQIPLPEVNAEVQVQIQAPLVLDVLDDNLRGGDALPKHVL